MKGVRNLLNSCRHSGAWGQRHAGAGSCYAGSCRVVSAGRSGCDGRPRRPGGVGEGLCRLLASALRQLPCRGRPSALVRSRIMDRSRASMPSTCRGATMDRVSAMRDCAARPAISPAIPTFCMDPRAPRTGILRRSKWSGSANRRPRSARRSRIPPAMATARSKRLRCMCATTSWSVGAGRQALGVSQRRARQRKPTRRSKRGRRLVLRVRRSDGAMNFCDFFALQYSCTSARFAHVRKSQIEDMSA